MRYHHGWKNRRNPDPRLRKLERRWQESGDQTDFQRYVAELLRVGQNPFYLRTREFMPRRDSVYYDGELRSAEKNWQEHPDSDYYPEPELFLESHRHPDGLPRWEDRPTSQDRVWKFYLHIPMRDGTEFVTWLGTLTCFEYPYWVTPGQYLQCTLESYRDLFSFDSWQHRALDERLGRPDTSPEDRENEMLRANRGLSNALSGGGLAFQYKALMNLHLPLDWTPNDPIISEEFQVTPLNIDPSSRDPDYIRPYRDGAQSYREGEDLVRIPDIEFYIQDYLFDRFHYWLSQTETIYGTELRETCFPLGPQLTTFHQGRRIFLHYWVAWDRAREIEADYHPHRMVYEKAYKVKWRGDYSARFYRWGNDPGQAEGQKPIRYSQVVNMDEPPEVHQTARIEVTEKVEGYLQKKLDTLISIASKYNYEIILVEGEPGRTVPENSWRASFQEE